MSKIEDLKFKISSFENLADRNGLSIKGLENLHQKRLELKKLMDAKGD